MKKLLLSLLFVAQSALAQNVTNFPQSIVNYQKQSSNETTLQLVLFDKQTLQKMHLNTQDLIDDANDLTEKINVFFKSNVSEGEKNSKKQLKNSDKPAGYLLITKYIFLGKDKPYTYLDTEENEDLKKQVYNMSECKEGVCTTHIIMGINYFDVDYKIKPLDLKSFAKKIEGKDEKRIRGDYSVSEEGVLKIYYFYGINGQNLPKDKQIIKNMIIMSKK